MGEHESRDKSQLLATGYQTKSLTIIIQFENGLHQRAKTIKDPDIRTQFVREARLAYRGAGHYDTLNPYDRTANQESTGSGSNYDMKGIYQDQVGQWLSLHADMPGNPDGIAEAGRYIAEERLELIDALFYLKKAYANLSSIRNYPTLLGYEWIETPTSDFAAFKRDPKHPRGYRGVKGDAAYAAISEFLTVWTRDDVLRHKPRLKY